MALQLPIPEPRGQLYSLQLQQLIQQEILNYGSISFQRYMQLCLYAPGLGYYQAGMQKLGQGGDFITAPEISPLFGRCIAQQIIEVLEHLGEGDIFEFGAGTGQLAIDILVDLEKSGILPKHYYILEVSADLQQRQQQRITQSIPHLASKVVWLQHLPDSFIGVILANEVLDAMPVSKFAYQQQQLREYEVINTGDQLTDSTKAPSAELIAQVQQLEINFADGYTSEINSLLSPWIASLSKMLKQGVALLIDYGFPQHEYYHPQRDMGTLMCHYQHLAHGDYFWWPGLQDITAHVDFTAIAKAAHAYDFNLAGYTNQAYFLYSCGLDRIAGNITANFSAQYQISQHIKKLVLPSEMGELFKVIALSKDFSHPLIGFQLYDMREKL